MTPKLRRAENQGVGNRPCRMVPIQTYEEGEGPRGRPRAADTPRDASQAEEEPNAGPTTGRISPLWGLQWRCNMESETVVEGPVEYRIPDVQFVQFSEKFAKLAKRAGKLGGGAIAYIWAVRL